MDYGVREVTYDCTCTGCKVTFKYTSSGTGPVNLCDKCWIEMLDYIFERSDTCPQWAMAQ